MRQDTELVSVVVPVRNEIRNIDATLTSILSQSYPHLEILVVDGMSTDGTRERLEKLARKDSRVRPLDNPGRTIPRALNVAADNARGRWLVRVDGHSTIPENYVAEAVRLLHDGWGGVGGRKSAVGGPPSGEAIMAVLSSPWGVGGSAYHYVDRPTESDHVPFGAYPVDVVKELGGWDERLVANEDFEFDTRLRKSGRRLLLDPALSVEWRCRSRIADLARQYFRYGRGKADVAFLHPGELRVRHLAPPLLVASLLGCLAFAASSRRPLAALAAAYLSALGLASVSIAGRLNSFDQKLRVPAALAAMHFSWGLGFWRGVGRLMLNGWRLSAVDTHTVERWDSPRWAPGGQAGRSGDQS